MWWGPAEAAIPFVELAILLISSSSGTVTEQPTSGVLTSPNYPELYPDPIELVQTIEVPVGNTIWIRFTDLQTDNHTGGQHFDRENIVQLSNPRQPVHLMNWHSEFLSDTNKVEVQFRRIEGLRAACWRLEWGMVRPEENRKRSGILTSLHFPDPYPAGNHHFTHNIFINKDTRIRFHFTSFNLQSLGYDHWVKIAQGGVGENLTPKLTGTSVPKDVITKPYKYVQAYVEFMARTREFETVTEGGGWRLEWNEIGEDEEIEENEYNEGEEDEEEG